MTNLFEATFSQTLWDNTTGFRLKMLNRMEAYKLANYLITRCKPFAFTAQAGESRQWHERTNIATINYFVIVNADTDLTELAKKFSFMLDT